MYPNLEQDCSPHVWLCTTVHPLEWFIAFITQLNVYFEKESKKHVFKVLVFVHFQKWSHHCKYPVFQCHTQMNWGGSLLEVCLCIFPLCFNKEGLETQNSTSAWMANAAYFTDCSSILGTCVVAVHECTPMMQLHTLTWKERQLMPDT